MEKKDLESLTEEEKRKLVGTFIVEKLREMFDKEVKDFITGKASAEEIKKLLPSDYILKSLEYQKAIYSAVSNGKKTLEEIQDYTKKLDYSLSLEETKDSLKILKKRKMIEAKCRPKGTIYSIASRISFKPNACFHGY